MTRSSAGGTRPPERRPVTQSPRRLPRRPAADPTRVAVLGRVAAGSRISGAPLDGTCRPVPQGPIGEDRNAQTLTRSRVGKGDGGNRRASCSARAMRPSDRRGVHVFLEPPTFVLDEGGGALPKRHKHGLKFSFCGLRPHPPPPGGRPWPTHRGSFEPALKCWANSRRKEFNLRGQTNL